MSVTSVLCGSRADLWPIYGFLCKLFSLYINVYQGWALQRSGAADPLKENGHKFALTAPIASKFRLGDNDSSPFHSLSCFKMPLHRERIKARNSLQPFLSEAIDWTSAWTPRYRRKTTKRPETQIIHTRGGKQSLAPVVFFLGYWLEQLERIYGRFPSVDQSSRFAGVPNLGKPLYREKTVYIKTHKTAINRPVGHTGETKHTF